MDWGRGCGLSGLRPRESPGCCLCVLCFAVRLHWELWVASWRCYITMLCPVIQLYSLLSASRSLGFVRIGLASTSIGCAPTIVLLHIILLPWQFYTPVYMLCCHWACLYYGSTRWEDERGQYIYL